MFSSNEARHTYWLTLSLSIGRKRQCYFWGGRDLAKTVRCEAFTQAQRANTLRFLLEVGVLHLYDLETGL